MMVCSQAAFGMQALAKKQEKIAQDSVTEARSKPKKQEKPLSPQEAFFKDENNKQLIIQRIRLGAMWARAAYDFEFAKSVQELVNLGILLQTLQPKLARLGMDHNDLDKWQGYQEIYQPYGLEPIAREWLSKWEMPAGKSSESILVPKILLLMGPPEWEKGREQQALKNNILTAIALIQEDKKQYAKKCDTAFKKADQTVLTNLYIETAIQHDPEIKKMANVPGGRQMLAMLLGTPKAREGLKVILIDAARQYANEQLDALVYLAEKMEKLPAKDIAEIKKAAAHEPN